MAKDQMFAGLKKDVRSLLISAKIGLTPDQLKRDYSNLLGYPLPLGQLGFRNVLDMVREIPDVVAVEYLPDGSLVLKAVGDETTRGIEELVAKQRKAKTTCKTPIRRGRVGFFSPRYPLHFQQSPMVLPRRGHAPPAIPVQLCTQLRQLLSQGPLGLSELEVSFSQCFGQPLCVRNYGFYSIVEMLGAASDIILVTQGRMGSMVSLLGPPVAMPATKLSTASPSSPISMNSMVQPVEKRTVESQKLSNIQNHMGSHLNEAISSNDEIAGINYSSPPKRPPLPTQEEQLLQSSVKKLEEELRQRILENSDAGTVSPELKAKLRQVVGQSKEGLSVHNLPVEYKKIFGEELPVVQSGFLSVTEMVGALSDILYLRPGIPDRHAVVVTDIHNVSSGEYSTVAIFGGEVVNCFSKGYYFSCEEESSWGGKDKANDTSPGHDDLEQDVEIYVTTNSFHQTTSLLPTIGVCLGSVVPPDAMRRQRLKAPTLRNPRELVPVLVEHVASPSHFFVRFDEAQEAHGLENMMIEMRSCYSCPEVSDRYRLREEYVRQGQVCCVAPREMWFYRVIIHHIIGDTQVEVYFADFGDLAVVERGDLKFLKSCYSELPAQAVPSLLVGIMPVGGIWTTSATSAFKKLCFERTLVAALHSYHSGFLQLFLCDTHTEEDVYLHGALQAQGHGLFCAPAVSSALCSLFNPVSVYMGEGVCDTRIEVEEELEPPIRAEQCDAKNLSYPAIKVNSESKATGQMPLPDLPELEFIEVTGVTTNGQVEVRNPFTALLAREPVLCCSNQDQGWMPNPTPELVQLKTGYHGDKVEPAPRPWSSRSQQHNTMWTMSPHTPSIMHTQGSQFGVPATPIYPLISNLMFPLLGTGDLYVRPASPFAFRPAARLAANIHQLDWYPH